MVIIISHSTTELAAVVCEQVGQQGTLGPIRPWVTLNFHHIDAMGSSPGHCMFVDELKGTW
jgi:hypothetical protein